MGRKPLTLPARVGVASPRRTPHLLTRRDSPWLIAMSSMFVHPLNGYLCWVGPVVWRSHTTGPTQCLLLQLLVTRQYSRYLQRHRKRCALAQAACTFFWPWQRRLSKTSDVARARAMQWGGYALTPLLCYTATINASGFYRCLREICAIYPV
jgi:hypothetical protein